MEIQAVFFDIGGVLELVPEPSADRDWEQRLALAPGEMLEKMFDAWRAGSVGTIELEDVHREIEYMADVWREYLGVPNVALIEFARALRPRYRTGIISNSFVGAREREQAAYRFEDLVDHIVYSHEAGFQKPDPRIYALACDRLNVAPERAVFVDDWDVALAGAADAGMHPVAFTSTDQVINELTALLS